MTHRHFARPVEFLTENGFAIVRRWEADGSPPPTDGSFCFLVRDAEDTEYQVTVNIANQLIKETEFNTRGRIQVSSSFWICCAERHLADYVEEHEHIPDNNKLTLETLNCEAVMLAFRWGRSDSLTSDSLSMAYTLKRLLVGKAKKTAAAMHERLTKKTGLAVFASDALSSTAYATEEILARVGGSVRVWARERIQLCRADHLCDRGRADHRRHQLSPDDLCLPFGRRCLHRR